MAKRLQSDTARRADLKYLLWGKMIS